MMLMATDIIRIHEIDYSKCSHAIHVGDAIIQIDGITIDNWSYKDLTQYLCNNVITSIEAIGYFHYKKRKLNNDDKDIDPPKLMVPMVVAVLVVLIKRRLKLFILLLPLIFFL